MIELNRIYNEDCLDGMKRNQVMKKKETRHPAKYTDKFIPIFAEMLKGRINVLDPFAGTCKISEIKKYGFEGKIFCNELEPEWAEIGLGKVDSINVGDAEFLPYRDGFFESVCTSPTYGNRMADHHEAKDDSRRNTYRHAIGRPLSDENTGRTQWGNQYRDKHYRVWLEIHRVLADDGILILNVKNHIRKGEEVDVCGWHKETLLKIGFNLVEELDIEVTGLGFGTNADKRVPFEKIYVFKKNRHITTSPEVKE
jgi:hypothetical protein